MDRAVPPGEAVGRHPPAAGVHHLRSVRAEVAAVLQCCSAAVAHLGQVQGVATVQTLQRHALPVTLDGPELAHTFLHTAAGSDS